ncbi:MAG: acyltransferase [Alphaproteobacteria bacterium]|nr:acyltransferase [Alphaproteobacteria bacterium]
MDRRVTPSVEAKQRFVVLDFLRFLMAICVVAFHYEIFIRPGVPPESRVFGGFDAAVDFFFILSGFVICHSYGDADWTAGKFTDYIRKRIARIYPLHIVTLMAFVCAYGLVASFGVSTGDGERYNASHIPAQLFLVHAWGVSDRLSFNHVSWSISAELFLYLVFPLLALAVRRIGILPAVLAIICCCFVLQLATHGLLVTHWLYRTYDFGILRALPSFAAGIVLWHVWAQRSADFNMPWRWPIIALALCVLLMAAQPPREIIIGAFAVAILLTALAETRGGVGPRFGLVMKSLGDASYGLYMLHTLVGLFIFKAAMPKIEWLGENQLAAALLAFVLSLMAALLSYRLFEVPARRWINSLPLPRLPTRRRTMLPGLPS